MVARGRGGGLGERGDGRKTHRLAVESARGDAKPSTGNAVRSVGMTTQGAGRSLESQESTLQII